MNVPLAGTDPRNPARRMSRWAAPLLITGAVTVVTLAAARSLGFGQVDDAYISYRYARNLSQGLGLVFNPGERVEGYSNFLWTLQLAAIARLGGDIERWAVRLEVGAHVGCLLLIMAMAARLCPRNPRASATAAGLIAATSPPLVFYALCGLETAQHTLLTTVSAAAAAFSSREIVLAIGTTCAAAGGLSRPEGFLLAPIASLGLACRRDLPTARRIRHAGVTLGTAWAVAAMFLGWRIHYYGEWLPNPFYAKVDWPTPRLLATGAAYVGEFVLGSFLLLWGPVWLAAGRDCRPGWRALVVLLFGAHAAFAVGVGGDWMPLGRFLVTAWPVMIVACVQAISAIAAKVGTRPAAWVLTMGTATAVASAGTFYRIEFRTGRPPTLDEYKRIGRWLARQGRPGESVAGTVMGVIPYYSGLVGRDFMGLTEPRIAKGASLGTSAPPGHRRMDGRYIFELRPTYLVVWSTTWSYPIAEEEFLAMLGRLPFPALWELLRMPGFDREYRYAVVQVTASGGESGRYLALYARRGTRLSDEARPVDLKSFHLRDRRCPSRGWSR